MSVDFLFIQVWNLTNCKLKTNHFGHNGYLNCVTVSPDGSLCASGGKVRNNLATDYLVILVCQGVYRGRERGGERVGMGGGSMCMSEKQSAVHLGKG